MVDVSRPQLTSSGLGISVPPATCSVPFGSSHLQGVAQDTRPFHPNPTFTSNHQLGNTTFQSASPQQLIFDHQAPASRQPSRQLQNQHHLLPHRTQRSSLPVNHGPSLDCYNVALEQNGSKLQYQHSAARLTSSPSLPPHPHPHDQKQSPSVLAHRHSSLQNSTHLSENNNGDRECIGAMVSPMHPQESLHRCSSARPPQNNNGERELFGANSCQTNPMQPERCSSERATLTVSHPERKGLLDGGNNTSSKQVNGDGSQDVRNQIRWLLFMEHARSCRATGDTCLSKFCLPVKKLLEHMKRCKIPDCKEPRCWQTRKLRLHYEECSNKSCPVCVPVNDNIKKNRNKRGAAQPMESSEPVQAHNNDNNKRGAEAISVGDDNLQPSFKRLKIEQPSQIATCERESMSASVSGSSMPKKERYGLQSVKVEVMPMDIDVTLELEKHVSGFIPMGGESAVDEKTICLSSQVKPKCMNEMGAPKKENVKQCMDDVDESKMEISSMVELFTPEQVKEHIRGLRQWVGQVKLSDFKASFLLGLTNIHF